jgi:hypothetical protein
MGTTFLIVPIAKKMDSLSRQIAYMNFGGQICCRPFVRLRSLRRYDYANSETW